MQSAQPPESEAQRRAVLAAVLAVQRGYVSAEGAMQVLGGLLGEQQPAPQAPSVPVPTAKEAPPVTDPVGTIMSINPSAPGKEIAKEVDQLIQKGGAALADLGLSPSEQATLFSLKPGSAFGAEQARKTLQDVARRRIDEVRSRLPLGTPKRYQMQRELARGGMGRILIATDTAMGRDVALKEVLMPRGDAGRDPSEVNPDGLDRFLREARVTGQLEHPGIVPVYEISRRDDGSIFYTMKLVRGQSMAETLAQIAKSGGTEAEKLAQRLKLLEAFLAVCHAIAYAHSRGVIHRDLKPHNIMLGSFGETVLLDWGLARVRGDAPTVGKGARIAQTELKHGRESRTLDGSVMGTPAYMPPEQARGQLELVDGKSDVYSLGAILYELLSGSAPYGGESGDSIIAKVLETPPVTLAECAPRAPAELIRLAEKAMERDRDRRLESAQALADEIAAFRDGRPLSVYQYSSGELLGRFVRRNKAAVAVAALAVAAVAAVISWSMVNVAKERDDAKAALATAEAADARREEVETAQQKQREEFVRRRKEQLALRLKELAALAPEEAEKRVRSALEEIKTRDPRRVVESAQEVTRTASSILDIANARAAVIRAAQSAVSGRQVELLDAAEIARLQAKMIEERLLAASLATANGDFALAELILNGTNGADERVAQARKEVDNARTALTRRHAARLDEILGLLRAPPETAERPVTASLLREFIAEVGAWRDDPVNARLLAAMPEVLKRVREPSETPVATNWPLYAELRFLAGVLVLQGRADTCVPVVADAIKALTEKDGFGNVAAYDRLVVELAIDLCRTESALAWAPLADLAAKAGGDSPVWVQVRRHFWRVPEPAAHAEDADPAAAVARAMLYRDHRRPADAIALLRATVKAAPEHKDAALELARLLIETGDETPEATELLDKILAAEPENGRALAFKGLRLMKLASAGKAPDSAATELDDLMLRAANAAPQDWLVRYLRGRSLLLASGSGDQKQVKFRDRAVALLEFTAAIDAGGRLPDIYERRCLARFGETMTEGGEIHRDKLPDVEWSQALADIDHAIALDPENARYPVWRMFIMLALGDVQAMAREQVRMLDLSPAGFQRVLQDLDE